MPREPISRVTEPLLRFMRIQAASGAVLMIAAATALALANSRFSDEFLEFWKTPLGFAIGSFEMRHSLLHWINDGLMVVFFFVVGLEIKHELVHGELRHIRSATLPIAAALGGMIVPAVIFFAMRRGQPDQAGWAIPMATDIAFVMGCLALLGNRVPNSLKVIMVTLAIVDDIGAILVIALVYTEEIRWAPLGIAAGALALTWLAARLGVRRLLVYIALGGFVWFGFHESGIHATIGGVILGLMTPARRYISPKLFTEILELASDAFYGDDDDDNLRISRASELRFAARETVPPAEFLQRELNPWVAFVVMPTFALANAGVAISGDQLGDGLSLAIVAGLFLGKPVGCVLFSWIATRVGAARLPDAVRWPQFIAASCLAGIGFTMSLFIANLALDDEQLSAAKVGILVGSALSAAVGMTLLFVLSPRESSDGT